MNTINIRKYHPKNSILKNLIKYYWIINSDAELSINNELFPCNNIDFIINLSSPINYLDENSVKSFKKFHFRGIRKSSLLIQQTGVLCVIGISFFPTGIFAILKAPLSDFSDKIIALDDIINDFDSRFDSLQGSDSDLDRINKLENVLLPLIDLNLLPKEEHNKLINEAYRPFCRLSIKEYCDNIGVNQRTYERSFKKYVGINPKSFIKLTRFQIALHQLISGKYSNLTSLSHNLNYFDQTHFIKDFKSYMRTTPLEFIKQRKTVKELIAIE